MKKILLITSIVALAIIAAYISITKNSTIHKGDAKFALEKIGEVDRIRIESVEDTFELENVLGKWTINDDEAIEDKVKVLLAVTANLVSVSPSTKKEREIIIQKLETGIQLSFFNGRKKVKCFKFSKYNEMLFAKLEKSEIPFRVSVRGYPEMDLIELCSPKKNCWLKDQLFGFLPDEIKYITLIYPEKPLRSFSLGRSKPNEIRLFDVRRKDIGTDGISTLAEEYFHSFSEIKYKLIDTTTMQYTTTQRPEKPFFLLHLALAMGKKIELQGFRKIDLATRKPDPFSFYGRINRQNYMLLKYSDFDPILVDIDYFLKK